MPLQIFNNDIPSHANDEEDDGGDDLGEDADSGGVGDEGEEEAHGLPEPVVGEGSLLVVGKETAVESIDLGLPDSVSNSPEGSKNIYYSNRGGSGCPSEHGDDNGKVNTCAKDEDGESSNKLDDEPKPNRSKGINNSKNNEDSPNNMNTISTGNKTLETKKNDIVSLNI